MDLHKLTLTEAKKKLQKKEVSSVELTKACLERIHQTEPEVNALVTITEDAALKSAEKADKMLKDGIEKPLLGIPLVIKDNFSTKDVLTTASSKLLDNYYPPFDSTVVAKLKDAGMVMLGKANMDAFAHGSSTETSDFGASKNPWNTDFLPGGSSGGSAASVAADQTIAAIGSETAGSIRQPASWCGIVGLKPTYGRVSRYGVVAMASSTDSPGPITKSVEDSAHILQVLSGKDVMDATTSPRPSEDYLKNINDSISGMTIGISDDYREGVDSQVQLRIDEAVKILEGLGAKVKKIKLFAPKYAIAVYTILQRSEVSSNLARLDGIRYGHGRDTFGDEAKRRIMLGTYTLSAGYYDAFYKKAQKVRTIIVDDFDEAFKEVDVIVSATSPSAALPVGSSKNHPMFGEMADVLVEPSSIAGIPGINIPVGFTKEKLPVGMQIMGPQFSERIILQVAQAFERNTDFHKERPLL